MLLMDKVYVITGAASLRRIGYATAELLAEHSAKVVVVDLVMGEKVVADINTSIEGRLQRAASVHGLRCDISTADSAGIVRTQWLPDIDSKNLDVMLDVNFKDAFYLCQSVLNIFVERRSRATPAGHRRGHSVDARRDNSRVGWRLPLPCLRTVRLCHGGDHRRQRRDPHPLMTTRLPRACKPPQRPVLQPIRNKTGVPTP